MFISFSTVLTLGEGKLADLCNTPINQNCRPEHERFSSRGRSVSLIKLAEDQNHGASNRKLLNSTNGKQNVCFYSVGRKNNDTNLYVVYVKLN